MIFRFGRRHPFKTSACSFLFCSLFAALLLFPVNSHASQWRVAPARIFLDKDAKSSVITVTNEGDEKVNLQVKAMEWTQDDTGQDVYKESNDLVVFPKILIIDKKEEKILRTGIKTSAIAKEKTYRLYIEEIPEPKKTEGDRTQIAIAVRFAIPVFNKPVKIIPEAALQQPGLTKGTLTVTVKNSGNVHFKVTSVTVVGQSKGEEAFSKIIDGWYILAGGTKTYSVPIPRDKCEKLDQLTIDVATDTQIKLNGRMNVEKAQCLP